MSLVPAQMWQGLAQSRRRCGRSARLGHHYGSSTAKNTAAALRRLARGTFRSVGLYYEVKLEELTQKYAQKPKPDLKHAAFLFELLEEVRLRGGLSAESVRGRPIGPSLV